MTVRRYWFIQCILVCYLLLYPVIRYEWNLYLCISGSIAIMVGAFFLFDFNGHLFYGVDNLFRWIVYLSVMLIGGGIYVNSSKIQYRWWTIPLIVGCVLAWYWCAYIGKGNALQLLSYFPLVGICAGMYQLGKSPLIERLFEMKISGNVLFIIGNLCLESYLIQSYIFTDALNELFPLNILLIMLAVLFSSYLLHILSSIISQIFDSKPFDKKALLLYKKWL